MRPTNEDLGWAVRRLRKDRKLTIETLAFAAEMHPTYLSSIERGHRNPTFDKLLGLVDGLGISMGSLFAEIETEAHLSQRRREALAELPAPLQLPGDPYALSRGLAESRGRSFGGGSGAND